MESELGGRELEGMVIDAFVGESVAVGVGSILNPIPC
jgi:hypothetical protein